jgi:hypothetical protein
MLEHLTKMTPSCKVNFSVFPSSLPSYLLMCSSRRYYVKDTNYAAPHHIIFPQLRILISFRSTNPQHLQSMFLLQVEKESHRVQNVKMWFSVFQSWMFT